MLRNILKTKFVRKKVDTNAQDKASNASEESIDDIMRKYDRESNTRIWEGVPKTIMSAFLALFSAYCIGMTLFSTAQREMRLSLFVGFIIVIGYLMYPARKHHVKPNSIPWYDIILMVVGAGSFFYFAFNVSSILALATRITTLHMILGILGIVSLIELGRRSVGLPIVFVVLALIGYALFNQFSINQNTYMALRGIIYRMFYTTSGVLGTPINVAFSYIVLFIIFGAFLERTGIAAFFISLANRIAGWSSGGAAKVAVISSALSGMVSGSSVGNTVTTGSVTIPMMKKTGYHPEFAAGVEAAASTGGQIMPPIMGAAAFLMAEYMGIPYIDVAIKAIIPALLYFAGIFITVHLEAKKLGLQGIPKQDLPSIGYLIKNSYLILPLVLLVWLVASGARTMATSAAISIAGASIVGVINFFFQEYKQRKDTESIPSILLDTIKTTIPIGYEALQAGAQSTIAVAVACGMAGMIAGAITVTGLASTLVNIIVNFAGDALIIGLVLTMITCIVLGMGVPTTANYCIMAATAAPILIQLGVPTVAAHFFVFYFGIAADITPPVALAAYAGSAIAKSNPMHTGFTAARLAIAAFIVPYILALNPIMLLEGDLGVASISIAILTAMVGLFGVSAGMTGHLFKNMHTVLRMFMVAGGIALMVPDTATDILGIVVIAGIVIYQYLTSKQTTTPTRMAHA